MIRKHVDPRCAGQPRRLLLFFSAGTPHAEIVIIAWTVHGVMSVKYTGHNYNSKFLETRKEKKKENPAHACNFKATHEEISIILYPRDGGLFIE